ncbi:MAG: glycosyltransferase [Lachnospiraceae bacterium]|nr:glycosyltransferase [Lachnospiraceae bacterium]
MISNFPLVSILVPVYGVEKHIERCAKSLFEQTYSNLEYIFVNDASPDNSILILQEVIKNILRKSTLLFVITQKT